MKIDPRASRYRIRTTHTLASSKTTKLGGVQLTSRAALLAGGKSGPAITPGNSETSLLIRAITQSDPKLKMPMAGEKLTEQEIADFSSWVQSGAPWPETEAKPG